MTLEGPRRDLLLTYDFPPMGGGIARWMAALAQQYPPGTLTVSTGTFSGQAAADSAFPNRVDRVSIHADRLKTLPGLIRWSRRAVALARDPAVQFLWCGTVRPAIYPAAMALWRTGLPYGVMVHGGDLLTLGTKLQRSTLKRAVMRRMLNAASVFVANSRWTATQCDALLTRLGIDPAGRVRVVPLGTDADRIRPDRTAGAAFRARRGLPDATWLVTVARLVPHKGIDTAIAAMAVLAPMHPDIRYLVVGRGHDADRLRALAQEAQVSDRVHILHDVTDDELPAAYATGDIYLGLSREAGKEVEGFGIALIEAAAAGLPVIAGKSGGIADAVEDGRTGILVPANDPAAASAVIERLLGDPGLARTMGDAGRARVLAGFTWARVVADLHAIAAAEGRS